MISRSFPSSRRRRRDDDDDDDDERQNDQVEICSKKECGRHFDGGENGAREGRDPEMYRGATASCEENARKGRRSTSFQKKKALRSRESQ